MGNTASQIREALRIEAEAVISQADIIDVVVAEAIVTLISGCKGKLFFTGCGTSGMAAKKAAHTFCCIARPASYLSPADAMHGGMGLVTADDIVVIFSKGGATPELTSIAKVAGRIGASVIAVSEKDGTPLTDLADYWLKVKAQKEADDFNMLATASTLSVIAVWDALAVCVMRSTGFTKDKFALIHPSGDVGNRLLAGKD